MGTYNPSQIKNTISTLNSVVLSGVSAGTIWYGASEDVSAYGRAGISIWTPYGEFCNGVITIEVSRDGVNFGGPDRTFSNTAIAEPHMWNIVEKYFRLKYTHGSISASTLEIQTQYSINADTLLGHQLSDVLKSESEAIVTRSVLVGQTPNGVFSNVALDTDADLRVSSTQISDNLNTVFITTASTSGSTSGNTWAGAPFPTRSRSIQENLIVVAAIGPTGLLSDLSGTISFKYYPDDNGNPGPASIVETLPVRSFGEVRNFGWLSNAGEYFSAAFTPNRDLVGTEFVSITTTHSKLTGNDFKRLPGQVLEEENQTLPVTSTFIKGFDSSGDSKNFRAIKVNEVIGEDDYALLVKNIIVGADTAGNFRSVGTDSEGHIKVNIDEPLTAFGELLTAQPTPVAQVDFTYGINTQMMGTGSTNGGSVTGITGLLNVKTSATTNSLGVAYSKRYVKYRNGQGSLGRFTALFTSGVTGNNQYAGIGTPDLSDGYFFGYSGTSFGIIHKSGNVVVSFIPQTSWNADKMDGSGSRDNASGQLLDPTKGNVYQIKMQFLGFGAIDFYIEDRNTGNFVNVHTIKYANSNDVPSLSQPSLNLVWASHNVGNNTVVTVKSASGALFNEGIIQHLGPRNSFDNNKAATATPLSIFTLKNTTTYNGINNRSQVRIKSISVAYDGGNAIGVFQLWKNATVAGSLSFSGINGTASSSGTVITNGNSVVSFDTTGAGVTPNNDSYVILNTSLARLNNTFMNVSDLDIYVNPGDTLTFACKATSALGAFSVSANWSEDI